MKTAYGQTRTTMLLSRHYFNEWDIPSSGIDTISIWIHPRLINRPDDFHEKGNIHHSINLRKKPEINHRTGQRIRTNFIVDIQAEAIDPTGDILEQVLHILAELVMNGTLYLNPCPDIPTIISFFYTSFSLLFSLDRLDFYFDLQPTDVYKLKTPDPEYPNTLYSSDYPSSLKVYNKVERQKQKRHISYEHINQIQYEERIEFHLIRKNCKYLHYQNIEGTFESIFLRYLPLLARKWRTFNHELMVLQHLNTLPYAYHLNRIVEAARVQIPHYQLQKTPLKPIPYKSARKKEVDAEWLPRFATWNKQYDNNALRI